MEEALRLQLFFFIDSKMNRVSILVLMEEALRHAPQIKAYLDGLSFNPCFNGRGVKTS